MSNMRPHFLVIFLLALASPGYAAETATTEPQLATDPTAAIVAPAAMPEITSSVKGAIDMTGDKERKVYVEFLASQKLTTVLRNAMTSEGYNLVDVREEADIAYILDGAFQAVRPATRRTAEIRVGEYAENPDSLKTKSGRGPSVALSLNPLAVLAGTIFRNVSNYSGAQDAVNSAVGDPDGKCLVKCDRWAYKQRNVVNLSRFVDGALKSTVVFQSEATTDPLVPSKLIAESLVSVSKQVGITLPSLSFIDAK